MMTLEVSKRDTAESAGSVRKQGLLPGVFYGRKEESTPVSVPLSIFQRIWRDAGSTSILSLTGVGEPKEVLIHDVGINPVTSEPEHVDFYVLEKGKKIEIAVPVEFEGEAPVEKDGGVVIKVIHEIEIKVAPAELPQHLMVDLSNLKEIGDQIFVSQVKIPPSAEFITDPEEVIVSTSEQQIIEEIETKPPTDEELAAAEGAEGGAPAAEGGETPAEAPKEEGQ
jgi:large subunit ribosomal protein L25